MHLTPSVRSPRLVRTCALALALGAFGPPAAAAQTAADSAAVVHALDAFHAALAAGDSAAALGWLAPDVLILEAGGAETLDEYRAHHLAADIAFARAVRSTRRVTQLRVAGATAWVASSSETVGTFDGRAVNSAGAELAVLSRSGGAWRIRAIHWSSRRRPER